MHCISSYFHGIRPIVSAQQVLLVFVLRPAWGVQLLKCKVTSVSESLGCYLLNSCIWFHKLFLSFLGYKSFVKMHCTDSDSLLCVKQCSSRCGNHSIETKSPSSCGLHRMWTLLEQGEKSRRIYQLLGSVRKDQPTKQDLDGKPNARGWWNFLLFKVVRHCLCNQMTVKQKDR